MKLLKNNNVIGSKSILAKLLKTFIKALSEPLTDLISFYFIKGIFLNVLKTDQVLPTFKKWDKINIYSPISLIFNHSILLQKLIYKRLYSLLEENNNLYPYQFGVRPYHSTNSALMEITKQIQKACDKGLFTCGVYLDLKRAFNTGNHSILLTKLKHCRIFNRHTWYW